MFWLEIGQNLHPYHMNSFTVASLLAQCQLLMMFVLFQPNCLEHIYFNLSDTKATYISKKKSTLKTSGKIRMPLFFSACPEEHKQSSPENQILHGATTDLSQVSPILNKIPRTAHKV